MLHEYSVIDGRITRGTGGSPAVDIYVLPNEEERFHLIHDLEIDEHTLASSIDPDETPRIEFEDTYTAIILKYPKNYSADDNFLFRVKSLFESTTNSEEESFMVLMQNFNCFFNDL